LGVELGLSPWWGGTKLSILALPSKDERKFAERDLGKREFAPGYSMVFEN
jgi:hypothetical protein